MTTDNQPPDDAGADQGDQNETPPSGATGEGVPQQLVPAPEAPASGSRPSRAPHLDTSVRPAITDEPAAERAIVTRAQRRRARRMELTRRQLFRTSFWGVMGFGLTGSLAAFLSFFWPRGVQGFGGKITVAAALVPGPGDAPFRDVVGKFWLANLRAGDGVHAGFGEPGEAGVLALWQKCPHLGCTVPWRGDFVFEGVTGWFRCPCHGSTYTRAGVRVFGPAPRPMDTMEITVNSNGSLTVDTGRITKGDIDNPQRTQPL